MRIAQRRPKAIPAQWERGYDFSHVYWIGRDNAGSVALIRGHADLTLRYSWQADNLTGYETSLERAKAAVEHVVWVSTKQLRLF
jgi:hypothetical protein